MLSSGFVLAVDVHYQTEKAIAAGVLFEKWGTRQAERLIATEVGYQLGEFYRRELTPVMVLLDKMDVLPSDFLVDGYVSLGREKKPGLGKYLYDALGGECIVIGVAKSRYLGTPPEVNLYRKEGCHPLNISAAEILQMVAKENVRIM